MHRLYLIVRADLPAGLQLAQTAHVARKFTRRFPEIPVEEDENLVVLACPNEQELSELLLWLRSQCPLAPCETFQEPDLENSLTAIAIVGTAPVRKRLSCLPLALGETSRRRDAA